MVYMLLYTCRPPVAVVDRVEVRLLADQRSCGINAGVSWRSSSIVSRASKQVRYLAEKKRTLFFQILQKIIQSSLLPSLCWKLFHQFLSSITFELIQFFKLKYDPQTY